MRYQMKQKVWSFGDDFTIKDDLGRDIYLIDGKMFSIGDKLSFKDMNGIELAYIEQKLLSLKKTYRVYRDGELFANIVKEWSFIRDKFTVDVPGPNDYEVQGDFWDHEFSFVRSGRQVAQISKKFFSWSDSYGVDIVDGEDDIVILATAVVIDLVCHDDDDRNSSGFKIGF